MMLKKTLFFLLFFITFILNAQAIVTKWNTNVNNDSSKEIKISTNGTYTYTYQNILDPSIIGSGLGNNNTTIITMPQAGEYLISITPTSSFAFKLNNLYDNDKNKITEIVNWGNVNWSSDLSYSFQNCKNLTVTATDIPNFSNVTQMQWMFAYCTNLSNIPNINNWNTGNVTNMSNMFSNAVLFNSNIESWNTSNVTNMSSMFHQAELFNQNLGNWDTSKVTDMSYMFIAATAFNQNIGNWNTSNVTNMKYMFDFAHAFNQNIGNWDTSKVTDMEAMFAGADAFNQNIGNWNTSNVTNMSYLFHFYTGSSSFNQDLSNWNISKVIKMQYMFSGANSFNQNIGNWTLNPNVNLSNMFINSGLNCNNYSQILKGWAQNPNTPTGRILGADNLVYNILGQTYRNQLITKGWTITGDTFNSNCNEVLSTKENLNYEPEDISFHPNPVTNTLYIKSKKKGKVILLNTLGQLLGSYNLNSEESTIDFSKFETGVYYISVKDKAYKIIKK